MCILCFEVAVLREMLGPWVEGELVCVMGLFVLEISEDIDILRYCSRVYSMGTPKAKSF